MTVQTTTQRILRQGLLGTLFVLGAIISSNIQAQWIEATGSALIRHGNDHEAKSQAVKNAIQEALLFVGASVSSVQQVTDGLLTQDHLKISSQGTIQQIELVNELHQQDLITVTIRADIIAQESQCFASEFQKSLAITQLRLNHREQAKIGEIYDIGKTVSNQLYKSLQSNSQQILPRPWYQQKINPQSRFEQYYDADLKVIDTIGQSTESQFVLFGQVTDLSFGEQTSNDLAFWQKTATDRFFAVDLILYNTSTKEQIFREQFETVGDWTFDMRRPVDVNGGKFWQSPYGGSINSVIERIRTALDDVIQCQPLEGKILRVVNNQIQFNLGTLNGIKKGQVFSIIHQAHFTDVNGKYLPRFVISPYQVKVVDVYTKTAIANSVNDELLSNIQTTDQVILKAVEEEGFD